MGKPAARLVSSNPAEAVSVGARESGAQTNRERWRESAERTTQRDKRCGDYRERERGSGAGTLPTGGTGRGDATQVLEVLQSEERFLKKSVGKLVGKKGCETPGTFELRTSGSTSGLARGDCQGLRPTS